MSYLLIFTRTGKVIWLTIYYHIDQNSIMIYGHIYLHMTMSNITGYYVILSGTELQSIFIHEIQLFYFTIENINSNLAIMDPPVGSPHMPERTLVKIRAE